MEILITNDDGYQAKGIKTLTEIMKQFGHVTVIAPKTHQSGMSMAVSLGFKQIGYKEIHKSEDCTIGYLSATPASCVKFGLNTYFLEHKPDVVVSGINHGSNAASASCYSGTLGAALEGALNGIPSIGVSLDSLDPDADFSAVEKYFPLIFSKLMENLPKRKGIIYNVNFPAIQASEIKGIKTGCQGKGIWIKEFKPWSTDLDHKLSPVPLIQKFEEQTIADKDEDLYVMVGEFLDDQNNSPLADHHLMAKGYISVTAHNVDTSDYEEISRLKESGFDVDF